jgi:AcrB/AcrD/AcrF family
VFLALAAQYENWSLPLAVILIVPMCLLSAMAGVYFRGQDNNIFTQIEFIVLVAVAISGLPFRWVWRPWLCEALASIHKGLPLCDLCKELGIDPRDS